MSPAGQEAPGTPLCLALPATLAALPSAQARLAEYLRAAGLEERVVGRAELLLEELVTNVIRHGGLAAPESARLTLTAAIGPDRACRLVFEDPGEPFDPLAGTLPQPPRRLEDAPLGGLGLVLLRRMAQDLAYARLPEGRNRLTLRLGAERGTGDAAG
ncbi:MAG: ATP-binding protein [Acetobacteraceae bacterium]|nr:ATP-binding protein [Acetobacteraceae bacterium]